ncbi:hypothetical protein CO046_01705 [Candidatus Peregrinibacteria bacterium CG_4_9_14_0_2_um_filter_53_11]|nr:MAG: hypothetical protein CO046_01705 [Candidatus Peregrinibacteria bacterium CG_4_9_14_0_2_um_filter_53_11]
MILAGLTTGRTAAGQEVLSFTPELRAPPNSVAYGGQIFVDDITELRLSTLPPSCVVARREVVFFEEGSRLMLERIAVSFRLKLSELTDPWTLICEPFLDGERGPADAEQTLEQLIEMGFPRKEVDELRQLIAPHMAAYNSVLWEWAELGQSDLLEALAADLSEGLSPERYWWIMKIALRPSLGVTSHGEGSFAGNSGFLS